MKQVRIVNGQVIRFMKIDPSEGQTLYGFNLVRAFEARYGFFSSPKSIEEFDLSNGVTFRHGQYKNRTVINQVKIYNNGILAEGAASTDEFYDFISDIVEWAAKDGGITVSKTENIPVLYNSALHVELEINLAKYFDRMNRIGALIDEKLKSYGSTIPSFQMAGIMLQPDMQGNAPTPFRFERLMNTPFESNLYFSASSLTTSDHLTVLTEFEESFKV